MKTNLILRCSKCGQKRDSPADTAVSFICSKCVQLMLGKGKREGKDDAD